MASDKIHSAKTHKFYLIEVCAMVVSVKQPPVEYTTFWNLEPCTCYFFWHCQIPGLVKNYKTCTGNQQNSAAIMIRSQCVGSPPTNWSKPIGQEQNQRLLSFFMMRDHSQQTRLSISPVQEISFWNKVYLLPKAVFPHTKVESWCCLRSSSNSSSVTGLNHLVLDLS